MKPNDHSRGDAELKTLHNELRREVPTVVFVNAVGMRVNLLEGLASQFDLSGFNFVSWELRGSPGPSSDISDCTLMAHVDDGLSVLSELGVEKICLVGWCTGASVAMLLAERLRDRVQALVSVSGAHLFDHMPGAPLGDAMYGMCQAIVADPESASGYYELTRPRGNEAAVLGLPQRPELVYELTYPYRQGVEPLTRYAFAITAACDYNPRLACKNVRCPTLVMAMRDDRVMGFENSVKAAELIEGARLHIFEEGGHYGLFTDDRVVAQMAEFLNFVTLS